MGVIEDGASYSGEGKKVTTEKKKKKDDRKHEVANGMSLMGTTELDTGVDKKSKKKKKKSSDADNDSASLHVQTKTTSVMASEEVASCDIIKKTKKSKKKAKIHEVSKSIASEDAQVEAAKVLGSGHAEVLSVLKNRKKRSPEILISEKADSHAERKQILGTSGRSDNNPNVDFSKVDTDSKKKKKSKHKKTKELPNTSSDHSVTKLDEKEGSKKANKRKRDPDASDSFKKSESKKKRVSFSDKVEVFTLPEHLKYRKLNTEGNLVQGKWYTPEEDSKIMEAVDNYIIEHHMASDAVNKDLNEDWKNARKMIMNCKEHPKLKGCWKDISLKIPWRTQESIYERAHLIYERAEDRKWTKEEISMILRFHDINGPKWRELSGVLGKSRKHVKDAYRRNKLKSGKKGAWSQEEYQKLFDLVNHDICLKALEEKKVKHGMLRDNIAWEAISESLGTRASPTCCIKWYYQLCSSMVVEGKWSNTDDYKLVDALYNQDACCIEDVEWDSLLEHRSGDLCQRRWGEMARNLGEYRLKPFLEQVEVLHQRYTKDMVEAREIYEKKVPVDV